MAELRTRPPTGVPPYPLILVDGLPKMGKTCAALELSRDDRVGRTFAIDVAEGSLDEYAPLGPFEVVDHNGTWGDFLEQLTAATEVPAHEGRPNVIVLDSGTGLWSWLSRWAEVRMRRSTAGRRALERDPDSPPKPTVDLWNDSKARWRQVVELLQAFPGIAVITARADLVVSMEDGAPSREKVWSVQAEKSLPSEVTAHVRFEELRRAELIGVRSLTVEPQLLTSPEGVPVLGHLVFDVMRQPVAYAGGTSVRRGRADSIDTGTAKQRLLEAVTRHAGGTVGEPTSDHKAEAVRLWTAAGLPNGKGTEVTPEELAEVLSKIGTPPDADGEDGGPVAPSGGTAPPGPTGGAPATPDVPAPAPAQGDEFEVGDSDPGAPPIDPDPPGPGRDADQQLADMAADPGCGRCSRLDCPGGIDGEGCTDPDVGTTGTTTEPAELGVHTRQLDVDQAPTPATSGDYVAGIITGHDTTAIAATIDTLAAELTAVTELRKVQLIGRAAELGLVLSPKNTQAALAEELGAHLAALVDTLEEQLNAAELAARDAGAEGYG